MPESQRMAYAFGGSGGGFGGSAQAGPIFKPRERKLDIDIVIKLCAKHCRK